VTHLLVRGVDPASVQLLVYVVTSLADDVSVTQSSQLSTTVTQSVSDEMLEELLHCLELSKGGRQGLPVSVEIPVHT